MGFVPTAFSAIAMQAAELLQEVEKEFCNKQKNKILVHLETSSPEHESAMDAAKLLFVCHPLVVPNMSGDYYYATTYDVDLVLRVDNKAARRVQNQYFIKLLESRLGVSALYISDWEQDTLYGYTRNYRSSPSFSYEKLMLALRELILVNSDQSGVMCHTDKEALRQKLLLHFGVNSTAAHYGNYAEKFLNLQVREVAGQPCFELVALDKKRTFSLNKTTYEYLTLSESWYEEGDDYEHHCLSPISIERLQSGAQYSITLSELLYVLE